MWLDAALHAERGPWDPGYGERVRGRDGGSTEALPPQESEHLAASLDGARTPLLEKMRAFFPASGKVDLVEAAEAHAWRLDQLAHNLSRCGARGGAPRDSPRRAVEALRRQLAAGGFPEGEAIVPAGAGQEGRAAVRVGGPRAGPEPCKPRSHSPGPCPASPTASFAESTKTASSSGPWRPPTPTAASCGPCRPPRGPRARHCSRPATHGR